MSTRDCTCEKCVNACRWNPGWFMPGEAEKAAELFGMDFESFKAKYLVVDYWLGEEWSGGDIDVLAPRKLDGVTPEGCPRVGFMYPFSAAPCIFLKDDRCSIHAAKPHECRQALACGTVNPDGRKVIAQAWQRDGRKT